MVVVSRSGTIGGTEKVTFAHEFTHALQDQNFGLEGIDVDAVGQGDRSLGRLALVEGDATLLMTRWLVSNLTPDELQDLLQVDPEARAQLERMPAILRETLLFPYQQGLIFVNGLLGERRLEGGGRGLRPAPRLHRAGPPPGQVRGGREAIGRPAGRRRARQGDGLRLVRHPRRHPRRVSALGLAAGERGQGVALPRTPPPAGAATASPTSAAPTGRMRWRS